MSEKGLDYNFLHYGIRAADMEVIEAVCQEHQVDYTWLLEHVLRSYNDLKTKTDWSDAKTIERALDKMLDKALNHLPEA